MARQDTLRTPRVHAALTATVVVTTMATAGLTACVCFTRAQRSAESASLVRLGQLASSRRDRLADQVEAWRLLADVLAQDPFVLSALESPDQGDGPARTAILARFRAMVADHGVTDLILALPDGRCVLSTGREVAPGGNVRAAPLADTALGKAVQKVLLSPAATVADIDASPPFAEPVQFAVAPARGNGTVEGILAFRVPSARLSQIAAAADGLSLTGDVRVVGPDRLTRSVSRFSDDPALTEVPGDGAVDRALGGEDGSAVLTDARGHDVLYAWCPLRAGDLDWRVIAQQDRDEALASGYALMRSMALAALGVSVVFAIVAAAAVALALSAYSPPLGSEGLDAFADEALELRAMARRLGELAEGLEPSSPSPPDQTDEAAGGEPDPTLTP